MRNRGHCATTTPAHRAQDRIRQPLLVLPVLLSVACSAKLPVVTPLGDREPAHHHVYYALPRTVAQVAFQARVVSVSAESPCLAQSDLARSLGLTRKSPGRYFALVHTELTKRTEPDPAQWYSVDLSSASADTVGLTWSPDGRIGTGEASASNHGLATAATVLQLAGPVAGKMLFGDPDAPERTSGGDSTAYCEGKASQIEDLRREQRQLLDAGAPPHEAAALELKLARLELAEETAASSFTGTVSSAAYAFHCEVVPSKEGSAWAAPVELFRFTTEDGILATDAEHCQLPEQLTFRPDGDVGETMPTTVSLHVQAVPGLSDIPQRLVAKAATTESMSFAYRVPAPADVWVAASDSTVEALTDRVRWQIPQLGTALQLSRLKESGKTALQLEFDKETGALVMLSRQGERADFAAAAGASEDGFEALIQASTAATGHDKELDAARRDQEYFEALAAVKEAKAVLTEVPDARD